MLSSFSLVLRRESPKTNPIVIVVRHHDAHMQDLIVGNGDGPSKQRSSINSAAYVDAFRKAKLTQTHLRIRQEAASDSCGLTCYRWPFWIQEAFI